MDRDTLPPDQCPKLNDYPQEFPQLHDTTLIMGYFSTRRKSTNPDDADSDMDTIDTESTMTNHDLESMGNDSTTDHDPDMTDDDSTTEDTNSDTDQRPPYNRRSRTLCPDSTASESSEDKNPGNLSPNMLYKFKQHILIPFFSRPGDGESGGFLRLSDYRDRNPALFDEEINVFKRVAGSIGSDVADVEEDCYLDDGNIVADEGLDVFIQRWNIRLDLQIRDLMEKRSELKERRGHLKRKFNGEGVENEKNELKKKRI
ncbi:hypothetical protein B7494_g2027 [Chlorociboria aeruginascens]|nr:hypothetical protein B7494_g2027 [Chlorociboria aeruginascens]